MVKNLEQSEIPAMVEVFASLEADNQRIVMAYMEGMATKAAQLPIPPKAG